MSVKESSGLDQELIVILSILTDFELTVGVPKAKDLMYVSVFK